jgi:hypothetical protein
MLKQMKQKVFSSSKSSLNRNGVERNKVQEMVFLSNQSVVVDIVVVLVGCIVVELKLKHHACVIEEKSNVYWFLFHQYYFFFTLQISLLQRS